MALDFINKFFKWGYGPNNGPQSWSKFFPIAESGCRQSPIDVVVSETEQDSSLQPVDASYGPGADYKLENTGASWQLHLWPADTSLTGGPLQGQYHGFQMHAHWGSEPGVGSEHTLNGHAFDAEIHIVHYNSKYCNPGEALDQPDGLAVVGILVQTGRAHPHFQIIASHLKNVHQSGSTYNLEENFNPALLFPEDRRYYTYPGSLTTPPLFESVTWILFHSHIELSAAQIQEMRKLTTGCNSDKCLVNNYRPPTDKKGRKVKKFQQ